jgi:hypothetical protein
MSENSTRLIRAAATAQTLTVYQAYEPQIAAAAVRAGTFVPPFTDITETVGQVRQLVGAGQAEAAARLLPAERVYPLDPVLAQHIGADMADPEPADTGGGTR